MKFKNFIFQAWKVMEFKLSVFESHGKLVWCRLVTADVITELGQKIP